MAIPWLFLGGGAKLRNRPYIELVCIVLVRIAVVCIALVRMALVRMATVQRSERVSRWIKSAAGIASLTPKHS